MDENKVECNFGIHVKEVFLWILGTNPQGLGTLLIGGAAVYALIQSTSLLDHILRIQSQARSIDIAVTELREQTTQITVAIGILSHQIKEMKAKETVEMSPVLKLENPTRIQIEEALKAIPQSPSTLGGAVYIPESRYQATVERLFVARTGLERVSILQSEMEYSPQLRSYYPARIRKESNEPIDE